MADGDDWPIGHVIDNERSDPQLPALAKQPSPDIEIRFGRDVWNPGGRGKIDTHDSLDEPLVALSKAKWLRVLAEARPSENEAGSGRGSLNHALKKGCVEGVRSLTSRAVHDPGLGIDLAIAG